MATKYNTTAPSVSAELGRRHAQNQRTGSVKNEAGNG